MMVVITRYYRSGKSKAPQVKIIQSTTDSFLRENASNLQTKADRRRGYTMSWTPIAVTHLNILGRKCFAGVLR